MKNPIIPLFLGMLLAIGQARAQTPALGPEEEAVKAVIVRETEMFGAANLEKWSATRTHAENTLTIGTGPGGTTILRGWQKQLADAAPFFRDNPGGVKIEVERTNWNVRVSGNVAWATYDQLLTIPQWGMKGRRTAEIRCLEKTGGQWAISVLTYTDDQPADTTDAKEAIKKVCIAETQAYIDHDYDRWAGFQAQDPGQQGAYNNPDGSFGYDAGWEKIGPGMREWLRTAPKDEASFTTDGWIFHIHGDLAFVAYNAAHLMLDGKTLRTRDFRVMTYRAGEWKILGMMAYGDHPGRK